MYGRIRMEEGLTWLNIIPTEDSNPELYSSDLRTNSIYHIDSEPNPNLFSTEISDLTTLSE